jgi:regulator of sigma D
MSEVNRSGVERRSQSQSDINSLVMSRSDTLSLYTDLAAHRPYSLDGEFPDELRRFCQALIDYTASAHFQLYQHLDENKERRKVVLSVADEVYEEIIKTTDLILTFNDRYGADAGIEAHMGHIEHDLSVLGEALADRIQNEDRIIEAMMNERRRSA